MKAAFLIVVATSILIGGFALYAGFRHNAMGEFCGDDNLNVCNIDYWYVLGIFGSWFIVAFVTQVIAIYIIRTLFRFARKKF